MNRVLQFFLSLETWHSALLSILTSALVSLFFNSYSWGSWVCLISFLFCSLLLVIILRFCRYYFRCVEIKRSNGEGNSSMDDSLAETLKRYWNDKALIEKNDEEVPNPKIVALLLALFFSFYASLAVFGYSIYACAKDEIKASNAEMEMIHSQLERQISLFLRDSSMIDGLVLKLEKLEQNDKEETELLFEINSRVNELKLIR